MKRWQKFSTITFSLVATAAVLFLCVFFFAPKTSTSPGSIPSHAATETLPTTNWVDYAAQPAVGSGTEADPWHIYTAEELAWFAATQPKFNADVYIQIKADIDLLEHNWSPINISNSNYQAVVHFDGYGHTISNLYVSAETSSRVGFIGNCTCVLDIKNFIFNDIYVLGADQVAGVVGYARGGLISENIVLKEVNITANGSSAYAAGIIARPPLNGSIEISNCSILSGKIISGTGSTGGFVGKVDASNVLNLTNCVNFANIECSGRFVGGIVGEIDVSNTTSQFVNCINYGDVVGNGGAGQVSGIGSRGKFYRGCANYGKITASGGNSDAAGIASVFANVADIENCGNFGDVTATYNAGGITANSCGGSLVNCMNVGNIKGATAVGGILGALFSAGGNLTLTNCKVLCDITLVSTQSYYGVTIGGLAGYVDMRDGKTILIENCYYDGNLSDKSENENVYGIGGLVGKCNYSSCIIRNSLVKGNLIQVGTSNNSDMIAGFVGQLMNNTFLEISNSAFIGEFNIIKFNFKPIANTLSSATISAKSVYYDVLINKSATNENSHLKEYVLGIDETEQTAFSLDVWLVSDLMGLTSMPVPKSLLWVGEYVENEPSVLQFLKNNGFTKATA